jgi:Tfp pilus assembly protein PilW
MKRGSLGEAGVTFLELLLAMVVGLVVLTAVYGVLINQSREYQVHRENVDVAETLKGAATILTSELWHASASRGDLYSIAAQTISLRSFQTAGAFCGAASPRFGVWQPSGSFASTVDDSALVFRVTDQSWVRAKVTQVWSNPGSPYVASCASSPTWTGGGTPPTVVQLGFQTIATDTVGIRVGSAIRGFRATTYSLIQSGGKSWLGRKVGNAASWDVVTGPLKPAASNGLQIQYYDATGAVTATPAQVAMVVVTLRAESYVAVRGKGGVRAPRADSVSVTAYLRN